MDNKINALNYVAVDVITHDRKKLMDTLKIFKQVGELYHVNIPTIDGYILTGYHGDLDGVMGEKVKKVELIYKQLGKLLIRAGLKATKVVTKSFKTSQYADQVQAIRLPEIQVDESYYYFEEGSPLKKVNDINNFLPEDPTKDVQLLRLTSAQLAVWDKEKKPALDQRDPSSDVQEIKPNKNSELLGASFLTKNVVFEKLLSEFMTKPLDSSLELNFINELYNMRFYVPVQIDEQAISPKNRRPGLRLDIVTLTYLADGKEYMPVFSNLEYMEIFLHEMGKNTELRPLVLSTQEMMFQARRSDLSGVLIDPGKHNFPLTNEYWNSVRQIRPINLDDSDDFKLKLISPETTAKLTSKLKNVLKKMYSVKKAWLLGIKLSESEGYEYIVIVDYIGDKKKFEEKIARKLALIIHLHLPYHSEILIGTADEKVGQVADKNFVPFYERRNGLFRKEVT